MSLPQLHLPYKCGAVWPDKHKCSDYENVIKMSNLLKETKLDSYPLR